MFLDEQNDSPKLPPSEQTAQMLEQLAADIRSGKARFTGWNMDRRFIRGGGAIDILEKECRITLQYMVTRYVAESAE